MSGKRGGGGRGEDGQDSRQGENSNPNSASLCVCAWACVYVMHHTNNIERGHSYSNKVSLPQYLSLAVQSTVESGTETFLTFSK